MVLALFVIVSTLIFSGSSFGIPTRSDVAMSLCSCSNTEYPAPCFTVYCVLSLIGSGKLLPQVLKHCGQKPLEPVQGIGLSDESVDRGGIALL